MNGKKGFSFVEFDDKKSDNEQVRPSVRLDWSLTFLFLWIKEKTLCAK